MMVVMPGYDMMWFGEDSSGSKLNWRGFLTWTELDEDIIVDSAQLTDWRENLVSRVNICFFPFHRKSPISCKNRY